MSDLTERLAEALAVCEDATDGPWSVTKMGGLPDIRTDYDGNHGLNDATFIAAARTGYPAALRALQAVLELHWPARFTGGTETGYEVGSEGDPCMECNLADREGLTPMVWPCPTVLAITEHLGATP